MISSTLVQGFDVQSQSAKDILTEGSYIEPMHPFWFFGNSEYDELCKNFTPLVRDAGNKALQSNDEANWESTTGKVSQLILCDQLSRHCFRGTDEAFKYDDIGLEIAKDLAEISPADDPDFYGSYTMFLALAFMHSETLEDHKLGWECLERAKITCPTFGWDKAKEFLLQHTKVIEQFGRYPHRNTKKGRETTKEEEEWLNAPDVPGWAKSQGIPGSVKSQG